MEFDILKQEASFRYQLLGRLQTDCDYYLGNGNQCAKHLWAGDEIKQIENMKSLWNSFAPGDKPEWLLWVQILGYEKKMIR